MIAGTLEIQMLADIARLQKDMDQAKTVVGNAMGSIERAAGIAVKAIGALGVGLSINAFANMIKGAINAQDELAKMSQRIGVSVEALAGLDHAAGMSGASLATIEKGLKTVSQQMLDAQRGLKASQENFAALGIEVTDATGKLRSADAVMIEVADQFAKMRDGTEKTALATKLFGRAGLELIPMLNEGSAGLAALVAQGQKLNPVTAESAKQAELFNDNMDVLGKSVGTIGVSFANTMLPVLSDFTSRLVGSAEGMDGIGKAADTAFRYLITGIGVVGDAFRGFHVLVKGIELAFAGVATAIIQSFSLIIEGYTNLANMIPGIEVDYEETFFAQLTESTTANFERVAQELQALAMKEIPSHQLEAYVASVRAAADEVRALGGEIRGATSEVETFTRVNADEWDALVDELTELGKRGAREAEEAARKAKKTAADAAAAQKKQAEAVAEAQRDAARKSDEEWMRFRDSFSDSLRDVGLRNDDVVETIKDAWKGLGWKIMGDLAASGFLSLLSGKGGSGLSFGGSGGAGGIENLFANAGTAGSLFSAAGGGKYLAKVATGGKGVITNAEFEQLMGGKSTSTGFNVTDLKNIGLSIGAGIAGSWAGTELGESVFGKKAESSWGATAGGAIGAMYGPLGAFIGSALGGLVDAAFGGDGLKRQNAGFLASPTPGLKDEYNAGDYTFASGLKVTLFARRTDPSAARDIAEVFGQVDESFVGLVKELGGQINMSGKTLRGLDEEATPGSYGNLFGIGGNGTTQGDIAAQLASYLSQLADNVTGLDQALIDSVKSAGSAEEALALLTQAVADKAAADKKEKESAEASAKALNEKIRLQDEYDGLTMTSTQLLDKQRDALEESNRALFDQVQALREAKRAEEERTAAFDTALDEARDFMAGVRSQMEDEIRDRYSRIMDAERDLHNRRLSLFQSLQAYTTNLRLGQMSALNPAERLAVAQQQYNALLATANDASLSMSDRVAAAARFTEVSDAFLKAFKDQNASAGYGAVFEQVLRDADSLKFLGVNKEFDPTAIQNAQLEELKKINEQLGILPPGIAESLGPLMNQLILYAIAAGKTPAATANLIRGMGPEAVKAAENPFKNLIGRDINEAATDVQEAQAAIAQINANASSEEEAVRAAVAAAKEAHLTVADLERLGVTGGGGSSVSDILARYGIPRFAKGGIVGANDPLFMVGDATVPEAVVPLPDGRTIPVTLSAPTVDLTEVSESIHALQGTIENLMGQLIDVSERAGVISIAQRNKLIDAQNEATDAITRLGEKAIRV